jgi:hypothetical protein
MEEIQALIERTEWLQDQVETLHETVARLQADLSTHQEALYTKLAELRHPTGAGEEPAPTAAGKPNRRTIPRRRGNPDTTAVAAGSGLTDAAANVPGHSSLENRSLAGSPR